MTTAVAQKRKGLLGNEKGLTLIELLAVIVILAIIAAIAIPSIGGIINRTKKESHRANAQILVDAARYAVTAEGFPILGIADTSIHNGTLPEGNTEYIDITLQELSDKGYLESIPKDPESSNQQYDASTHVRIHRLVDSGKYRYEVYLVKANGNNVFDDTDGYVLEEDIKTTNLKS